MKGIAFVYGEVIGLIWDKQSEFFLCYNFGIQCGGRGEDFPFNNYFTLIIY